MSLREKREFIQAQILETDRLRELAGDQELRLISALDGLNSCENARWSIRGKESHLSAPSVRKPGYNHEFFVCKAAPKL
jgi:hypothetical protein